MFYTRRGDEGYTDLIGGPRVAKESQRIAALGDIDEATSAVGLARAHSLRDDTKAALLQAQKNLYLLMADLATVDGKMAGQQRLTDEHIIELETTIAEFDGRVSIPKQFVAPGDSVAGAALDVARAIVRRAERSVTHLVHADLGGNRAMAAYLNRLSSLLFGLARYEDAAAGANPTLSKTIE